MCPDSAASRFSRLSYGNTDDIRRIGVVESYSPLIKSLQARCQRKKIEPSIYKLKAVKLNQVGGKPMKRWIPILIVVGILLLASTAFGAGPQIIYRDGKISVNADNVPLGDLLRLWDQATGMQSSVPPELSEYKLTVHFTDLNINDAVRRMFVGQSFGYGLMEGRGVVVTGPATDLAETEAPLEPIDTNATEIVEAYDGSMIQ